MHTGRVILEFGVHERFEFGEFDNFVVHGVHFFVGKTEQGAVQIDIFAASQFRIKTDAEFDEGDESAIDFDSSLVGVVDLSEKFEEGGFAGAVATDDTNKFTGFDFEVDAA